MKRFLKLSRIALLLLMTPTLTFASLEAKHTYTFEEQLEVALKRQLAGVPFDAPLDVKDGWQDFFKQSIERMEIAIRKDNLVNPGCAEELTLMLDRVGAKGKELFEIGEMDTHWYLFLNRLMGQILSKVQGSKGDGNLTKTFNLTSLAHYPSFLIFPSLTARSRA